MISILDLRNNLKVANNLTFQSSCDAEKMKQCIFSLKHIHIVQKLGKRNADCVAIEFCDVKIILSSRVDFGPVASGNNERITVILLVDLIHKSFDMVIKKRKSSPCFCIGFFITDAKNGEI